MKKVKELIRKKWCKAVVSLAIIAIIISAGVVVSLTKETQETQYPYCFQYQQNIVYCHIFEIIEQWREPNSLYKEGDSFNDTNSESFALLRCRRCEYTMNFEIIEQWREPNSLYKEGDSFNAMNSNAYALVTCIRNDYTGIAQMVVHVGGEKYE